MTQQTFAGSIAETNLLAFIYGNDRIIQGVKHVEQAALLTPSSLLDMLVIPVLFLQLHLFIKRR